MCEITTIFFHFCFVYIVIYGIVMNKPRIWLPLRNLVIYFFYFNYIKQLLRSTNLYISAKYFIYYGLYVQIFLFNHAIVLRNSLTTHFSSTEARDYMFTELSVMFSAAWRKWGRYRRREHRSCQSMGVNHFRIMLLLVV